jgi:choline-sulfatase
VDLPPELFDLENDPDELANRAEEPDQQPVLGLWTQRLNALCDPREVDQRAKSRQNALIDFFGGDAAIRSGQGMGGYTPSPMR